MTDAVSGQGDTGTTGDQATGAADAGDAGANPGAGDAGNGGGQSGDGQGVTAVVPEAYEYTLPEGMVLDQGMADSVAPVFKELGLTNEQANKLVGVYAKQVAESSAAQEKAAVERYEAQIKSWQEQLKSDKDFGGDKMAENIAAVRQFIDKTVPAELKDMLLGPVNEQDYSKTGFFNREDMGNNPPLLKYLLHLSRTFRVGEDQPGSGNADNTAGTIEERWYGKSA